MPVEDRPGSEEDANRQGSDHAEYPDQKSDEGGRLEVEPCAQRSEFREAWDFEGLGDAGFRTAHPAGMAEEGTDDELGSAAAAGGAAFEGNDYLGRGCWRWGAPKFMLSLIGCGCHKEFFL